MMPGLAGPWRDHASLKLPKKSSYTSRHRCSVNHAATNRLHSIGAARDENAIPARIVGVPEPFPAKEKSIRSEGDSEDASELVNVHVGH
jgi:hypothetical protein